MNDRLDYVSVETQDDARILVNKIINEIKIIYDQNQHLNKNLVYWHPDLITPSEVQFFSLEILLSLLK